MRIREGMDGIIWAFNENAGAWFEITDTEFNAEEVLDKLVKDEMAGDNTLSFSEALTKVQRKHPGIAKKFLEQLRARR